MLLRLTHDCRHDVSQRVLCASEKSSPRLDNQFTTATKLLDPKNDVANERLSICLTIHNSEQLRRAALNLCPKLIDRVSGIGTGRIGHNFRHDLGPLSGRRSLHFLP